MIAAGLQVGPSEGAEEKKEKKKVDTKKRGKKNDQKVITQSVVNYVHFANFVLGGRRETPS
jgi:hypothetical protein